MYPITKEKSQEYNKRFYANNKDKKIKYYNENNEYIRKKRKEHYKLNKDSDNLRRLKSYYHKKEFHRLSNILL